VIAAHACCRPVLRSLAAAVLCLRSEWSEKGMRIVLNILFWLVFLALVSWGCYMAMSTMGARVFEHGHRGILIKVCEVVAALAATLMVLVLAARGLGKS
jgi:hypothetical protein